MPLSRLRRPAFLLAALAVALLHGLRARGFLAPEEAGRPRAFARVEGRVCSPAKEDSRGVKLLVKDASVEGRPFAGKVLVYLPRGAPRAAFGPGRAAAFEGRLRAPRRPRNPGEFDERSFLADRGAGWVLHASTAAARAGPIPWRWRLKGAAEAARRSVEDALAARLPEQRARVLTGLLLGYKGPLRRDLNRAVQDAGVMHLLVPSGAKVAFVMAAAAALARRLGLRPRARFCAVAAVGGFYTLMVGGEAPYARAYLAGLALQGAALLGREPDAFQAMALSALAVLAWEPREAFSAGFQMTYAAVGGLLAAMPRVQRALPKSWPRWARGLAALAAASLLVQLMLWPFFANLFGRGSLVGAAANLILVPASGFLMAAAFLAWTVSWHPAAAEAAARAAGWLAEAFLRACSAFAALPGAAVELSPMSAPEVAAFYLVVFAVLLLPARRAAWVLAAGAALWAGLALAGTAREPVLRVLILSLPRGRPALVRFADGRRWLVYDGGAPGAVLRALKARGVRRLDRLVLTGGRPASRARLAAAWPGARLSAVSGPLPVCAGRVCFDLGGPGGPRVRKGEAEYSIIGARLRRGAVEAVSDGRAVAWAEARSHD